MGAQAVGRASPKTRNRPGATNSEAATDFVIRGDNSKDNSTGTQSQRAGYPDEAGFKGDPGGPGAEGAAAIKAQIGRRQREALDGLRRLPGQRGTAEQVAALVGRHWFHVRPRLSECKALGLVVIEPERGVTGFGKPCSIYRVATPDELSLFAARKAADAENGEAGQ